MSGEVEYRFENLVKRIQELNSTILLEQNNTDLIRHKNELIDELWAFFPEQCEVYDGPVQITY